METIKYETGDQYVEIEISEEVKSTIASIRRQTQFEEEQGERAFIERALSKLDTLGRHTCIEDFVGAYDAPKFEAAQAAGRNSMRFLQALHKWGNLTYHQPGGEWTLHGAFLRGADGSDYLVNIWPSRGFSIVEVVKDE